jgi:hypothetical protein
MGRVIEAADLVGHWVHSHEEDTAAERVYRPAAFPFPRSRGRRSFELKADGSLVDWGISPTDTRRALPGKWTLEAGGRLVLDPGPSGGGARELKIAALDRERLVVKKA